MRPCFILSWEVEKQLKTARLIIFNSPRETELRDESLNFEFPCVE